MPVLSPDAQNLFDQLINHNLMDTINDPELQQTLNGLNEADQKGLAQRVVVKWATDQNLNANDLLAINRNLPDAHMTQNRLIGFEHWLKTAVQSYAVFHGFCDVNNPHPEQFIDEITPEIIDDLTTLPALKSWTINDRILPSVDVIIAKIADQKTRAQLCKTFHSEPLISEKFAQANEVKDWLELLNGEQPWGFFEQNLGVAADMLMAHADLLRLSIPENNRQSIAQNLNKMPETLRPQVTHQLRSLSEAMQARVSSCTVFEDIYHQLTTLSFTQMNRHEQASLFFSNTTPEKTSENPAQAICSPNTTPT